MRGVRGVGGMRVMPTAAGGVVRVVGMMGVMAMVRMMGVVPGGTTHRVAIRKRQKRSLSHRGDRVGTLRDRGLRSTDAQPGIGDFCLSALGEDRGKRQAERNEDGLLLHFWDHRRTDLRLLRFQVISALIEERKPGWPGPTSAARPSSWLAGLASGPPGLCWHRHS